jgi:DNA-binding GntR family transcriptional regulator
VTKVKSENAEVMPDDYWLSVGLDHRSLGQTITERLRDQILINQLKPGERLIADDLALTFGVSRSMIREALLLLATEGFINIIPRKGTFVTQMSAKQANDLFEVRLLLEGQVASLAAERRTDENLRDLRETADRGLAAALAGNVDQLPALNTRFHNLLADTADNDYLTETLSRLSNIIQWVYSRRIIERSTDSWKEHLRIVDAIERMDPAAAKSAAHEHITRAWAAYQQPTG